MKTLHSIAQPRIYSPPTPLHDALLQIHHWLECPTLTLIGESGGPYFHYLEHLIEASQVTGARTHDARIAALCLPHGGDDGKVCRLGLGYEKPIERVSVLILKVISRYRQFY